MKYILSILFLVVTVFVKAQPFSMPSQPYRNLIYVNPAFTGYYETTIATLMNRSSWIGFPGKSEYQNFEVQAPLKNQSIALGLQAMHQQIGANSSNEIFFNYCHRISLANSKITFGLKGGIASTSMSNFLLPSDIVDPAYPFKTYLVPNFGLGLAFYSRNFYAGVSVPYLLGISLGSDGNVEIAAPDFNNMNFILSIGGKIPVGNNLKIEPHGLLVYSLITDPSYEGVVNINISDKIILGGGYSSEKAAIANLGYYLNKQISFLYSYQYNTGDIGKISNGSHELGLLFYFGYKIKTSSPRDF
jgi:type IX secretion system PorP/SprF family membrane protein